MKKPLGVSVDAKLEQAARADAKQFKKHKASIVEVALEAFFGLPVALRRTKLAGKPNKIMGRPTICL